MSLWGRAALGMLKNHPRNQGGVGAAPEVGTGKGLSQDHRLLILVVELSYFASKK